MKKIKVLIIDEDILARQTIANILNKEPTIETRVSGNFDEIESITRYEEPDVVLLNADHPASDGLSPFDLLRNQFPKLPVVILGSRSEKGAKTAINALRNGAVDFITKPEQNNALLFAGRHLIKRLIPIIKAAARFGNAERTKKQIDRNINGPQYKFEEIIGQEGEKKPSLTTSLLVMGGCTGGPRALFSIFKSLPPDLPVPIVIAQHFPKIYTYELAKSLNKTSKLTVLEGYNGADLTPGTAWLAPGGYHSEVQHDGNKSVLKVHRGPRVNGVRPSIDVLFESAARLYGTSVLGIILSGCGLDGLEGARKIKNGDGLVLAQDPKDALAGELPLSVIKAGLTNQYYPADKIGYQIVNQIIRNDKQMFSDKPGTVNPNRISLFKGDRMYFKLA